MQESRKLAAYRVDTTEVQIRKQDLFLLVAARDDGAVGIDHCGMAPAFIGEALGARRCRAYDKEFVVNGTAAQGKGKRRLKA